MRTLTKAIVACVSADVPVMLWGPPGTGKTAFASQIAPPEWWSHPDGAISPAQIEPPDLVGALMPDTVTEVTRYLPAAWAVDCRAAMDKGSPALLVIDEANSGGGPTRRALLRLFDFNRALPGVGLKGLRLIGTANPYARSEGCEPLGEPTTTRWAHMKWTLSPQEWIADRASGWPQTEKAKDALESPDALQLDGYDFAWEVITTFLGSRPDLWRPDPPADVDEVLGWPCDRTWDMLAKAMGSKAAGGGTFKEIDTISLLAVGVVGKSAGDLFVATVEDLAEKLVSVHEILKNPDAWRVPSRPDHQRVLCASIVSYVTSQALDRDLYNLVWRALGHASKTNLAAACSAIRTLLNLPAAEKLGLPNSKYLEPFREYLSVAGALSRKRAKNG